MKNQTISIQGMHCRSCEILIEEELKNIKGVEKVSVNHKTGKAELICKCEIDKTELATAIENAGYTMGEKNSLPLFSKNTQDYNELALAIGVTVTLYFLAQTLGIFDLGSSISGNYSNLSVVFLIGLTAGVSTCMALVGGLVMGISSKFASQNPDASEMEKFKPHLFFNAGRIASYFILGGVIGWAGSLFQLSTSILAGLTVLVGLVMLILGLQLIKVFPIVQKISFTFPKFLYSLFGMKDQSQLDYSNKNAAVMGALTFFLPCGFTQAIQLYAISTANPMAGAMTMGVFSLGTTPGLLGIGGLSAFLKGDAARLFFKVTGVVVIALAVFNISNGLNLLGLNPWASPSFAVPSAGNTGSKNVQEVSDPNVTLVNGVQEVRMTQKGSGYSPNKFTIKKGVPVKWIVNSTDDYSCASSLYSKKLGILKNLVKGENIFEFTPNEVGVISFSCSMGMYTGAFNVVE